jgi:S1-C subfamily serine protease
LGSSGDLLVGQRVYAIGNPFGLDQTLTTGIISGLHREIRSPSDHRIRDVIQTDAAINPGNSGGPLLDSAGRLIGINTAIVSPSGAYAGVGFAVPVDVARRAVPQLIEKGRVSRPGLGIYMIPDELMRYNGLRGVGIEKVEERGPAARAGLRSPRELENGRLVPDIILSVDGQKVERQRDLFDLLDGRRAGESVKVRVRRGGEVFEVEVALAELR